MERFGAALLVVLLCVLLVSGSGCVVALGTRHETDVEDIRTKIKEIDERLKKVEENLGMAAPVKETTAEPEPAK